VGTVVVFLLLTTFAACTPDDEPALPTEFVGRVEAIDQQDHAVVWHVTCGSRQGDRLTTPIARATFEVESDPQDPSSGHIREESFTEWADAATGESWVVETDGKTTSSVRSTSAPVDHDPCAR
jgi:hypothetical protein